MQLKRSTGRLLAVGIGLLYVVVAYTQSTPSNQRLQIGTLPQGLSAAQPSAPDYPSDPRAIELERGLEEAVEWARTRATNRVNTAAAAPRTRIEANGDPRRAQVQRRSSDASSSAPQESPLDAATLRSMRAQLSDSGTVRSLRPASGAQALERNSQGTSRSARRSTAMQFFERNRTLLGLRNPESELQLRSTHVGKLGGHAQRFEQRYGELPVWGAELVAQTDEAGNLVAVNGSYFPTPRKLPNEPVVDTAQAADAARDAVAAASDATEAETRLVVYAESSQPARLAWEVKLEASTTEHWLTLVDASNGRIMQSFNQVASNRASITGHDLFGQLHNLSGWHEDGAYHLVDASKPMFDAEYDPLSASLNSGTIQVADWANAPQDSASPTPALVASTQSSGPWLADGISAAASLSHAYDYFRDQHQHESMDGNGSSIMALVRFGEEYNNAAYVPDGPFLIFGDARPFAGALDVVGHEFAHGVTATSAKLRNHKQSGALAEAFSDIFGELIEAHVQGRPDWIIGSRLSNSFRDMADPERYGQPARMSDYVVTSADNGGVHLNSGIVNHAFYLLAEGFPNAIGLEAAGDIFYRALTSTLVSSSDFHDARSATIQAAEQLYGQDSTEAVRTAEAFDAVGIHDSPTNADPGPVPAVEGRDSVIFSFLDSGSDQYYLGRRDDALGDPVQGTYLSGGPISLKRPSVSRDGEIAAFINSQHDVCLIATTAPGSEACAGLAGSIYSVTMSPDGNSYGVIFQDAEGNPEATITIINIETEEERTIPLVSPALDGPSSIDVLQADAMDFTSDSRFLIYDAFNEVTYANGSTIGSWSIYAYDLISDATFAVIPPIQGVDIGYPSVASTNDFRIAFDAWDVEAEQNSIHAADLLEGELNVIGTSSQYSLPAFSGDDTSIVYTDEDVSAPMGSSLFTQSVGGEHGISAVGSRTIFLEDAAYGAIYRRGTAPESSDIDLELTSSIVDESYLGEAERLDFTVQNNGDTAASGATVTVNMPDGVVSLGGSSACSMAGDQISCDIGEVASNEQSVMEWRFELQERATKQFGLSVFATQHDPNVSDNSSFSEIAVVNRAPRNIDPLPSLTMTEGSSVTVELDGYFDDPDGDTLEFEASGLPSGVSMSSSGSLSGSVASVSGDTSHSVTVTASDSFDDTAMASFSLSVEDAPDNGGSDGGGTDGDTDGSGGAGGSGDTDGGGGGAVGFGWALLLLPYLILRRRERRSQLMA